MHDGFVVLFGMPTDDLRRDDASMSGSSVIVAINALMLKRTKLDGVRVPSSMQPAAAAAHAH